MECGKELTWWCHQKEVVGRKWTLMEEDELLASHYVSYKERALEKRIGLELKSNRDSRI